MALSGYNTWRFLGTICGVIPMTTLQVQLPDRLAQLLREMVEEGWFTSEEEAVRAALWEFLRRHSLQLTEQFQLEDIEWARQLRQNRNL